MAHWVVWRKIECALNLSYSDLIGTSQLDPYRRVYRNGPHAIKIVAKTAETTSRLRLNTLQQEYEILRVCEGTVGVPRAIEFVDASDYEYLVTEFVPGRCAARMFGLATAERLRLLSAVLCTQFRLARRCVCHNDLTLNNILRSDRGEVFVIDFDQASRHPTATAMVRSLLGIPVGKVTIHKSYLGFIKAMLKEAATAVLPSAVVRLVRRGLGRSDEFTLPVLSEGASVAARKVLEAWQIAQASNASSPGFALAYYDFRFEGYRFPGERPWLDRWRHLSEIVDYRGKKILELGCNVGLLSTYVLHKKEAAAALGVDADSEILRAASLVAQAHDVSPTFRHLNFDSQANWEEALIAYAPDVVFALNVLNWVQDKQRFLSFLGRFDCIVFEGHDRMETEVQRLRSVGFKHFHVVVITERNREVILCRK